MWETLGFRWVKKNIIGRKKQSAPLKNLGDGLGNWNPNWCVLCDRDDFVTLGVDIGGNIGGIWVISQIGWIWG